MTIDPRERAFPREGGMTPLDFRPGMKMLDEAGHIYDLLAVKDGRYATHSQHGKRSLLVRRQSDGVERWVWASTAVAMVADGKLVAQ